MEMAYQLALGTRAIQRLCPHGSTRKGDDYDAFGAIIYCTSTTCQLSLYTQVTNMTYDGATFYYLSHLGSYNLASGADALQAGRTALQQIRRVAKTRREQAYTFAMQA
jgi:hypothetical protein